MSMPESVRKGAPTESGSSGPTAASRLPPEFTRSELASVRARRAALGIPLADTDATGRVGLAISGGGIRSATFALGVLQALARHRRLRHVDYLSTVSGGGYIGAFLGSLYLPPELRNAAPGSEAGAVAAAASSASTIAATATQVEDILADGGSPPLRWLREHGRYIAPRGAGDILYAIAIYLRNWVSLHYVLAVTVLSVFLAGNLLRTWLGNHLPGLRGLEARLFEADAGLWWSPWFALPLAGLALLLVPLGWAYWLTQTRQDAGFPLLRNPALVATFFVALCAAWALHRLPPATSAKDTVALMAACWLVYAPAAATIAWLLARRGGGGEGIARNRLSRWLAASLATALLLVAWALVDSLGQTLYRLTHAGHPFGWTTLVPLASAVVVLVQRFAPAIDRLGEAGTGLRLPALALASMLGFALFAMLLAGWSAVGHALLWGGSCIDCGAAPGAPRTGLAATLLAALLVIALLTARTLPFLNLSTLAQFYSARLARAYLGASHPRRSGYRGVDRSDTTPRDADVTQATLGDEIRWHAYRPDLHGGPLHFINVTINETVIGAAQLAQRDRKGLPMTVGPFGLSVGRHRHARWDGSDARIVPLSGSPHQGARPATPVADARAVEPLGLGQWMAISGAAFSTGLGARTRMGLSMLLALSNARLGYWWDSGVGPRGAQAVAAHRLSERASAWLARLAPVQACLAAETLARFHGTRRRRWHLSDGGHFENTGVYELLRRRVPFIIACDDGQDQDDTFRDFGNLVRKARIDWGAEIDFLSTTGITELLGAGSPLLASVGTPAQLRRAAAAGAATSAARSGGSRHAERHATLAWVRYEDDPAARSLLLILRPVLLGDEPLDLQEYAACEPDFPQQSTADQSFDEAQWESYRRLGEYIADRLFGTEALPGCWAPHAMAAPGGAASSR